MRLHTGAAGAKAGTTVVRAFSFKATTPNLDTGVPFYTPAVGEVLLNLWFSVETAWNIAPAAADIGIAGSGGAGFFGAVLVPVDMATLNAFLPGVLTAMASYQDASTNGVLEGLLETQPGANPVGLQVTPGIQSLQGSFIPVTFLTTDPLEVWVTQDGSQGGTPTGSNIGDALIYIVTATPTVEAL